MIGRVVSNKMKNTVVVAVETLKAHSLYHRQIKHTKKIKAATDQELVSGQVVRIEQTRPIAGGVTFKVMEVIEPKGSK